jgi:DNA-binding HxlR family transcriptional regulator
MTTTDLNLLPERNCGITSALDIVGDRWSLLIVREVWRENRRFSGIVETIGAPRDRVAARLKQLVALGVLERVQYQSAPDRFEYRLKAAGEELTQVLTLLFDWGKRWGHVREGVELHHAAHQLTPQLYCATCGEFVAVGSAHRVARAVDAIDAE